MGSRTPLRSARALGCACAPDHQNALAPLFSHCVSLTINAVREPHQPRREALRHADRLAAAVSLDMVSAGWSMTADNYLSRITKAQILEAVREAKGESTAQLIAHLKKADMAREAERLLEGTGWLPEALRTLPLEDSICAGRRTGRARAAGLPDRGRRPGRRRGASRRRVASPFCPSPRRGASPAPLLLLLARSAT